MNRNYLSIFRLVFDPELNKDGFNRIIHLLKKLRTEKNPYKNGDYVYDVNKSNMWEFNQDALAFYEAAGFKTFRRYMEMMI